MDWLVRLKAAYAKHAGIGVVSGLNPYHFGNFRDAPFTHYFDDSGSLTNHLGISLWELMMLERVCRALAPRSIFIIGNGLGWSALALAMMNAEAFVVVVEPDVGIELTNRIAFHEQLKCVVVKGLSPDDNARIIRDYCTLPPDFVLVDGNHVNEQIVRDFDSTFAISGRNAAYFFHDVVVFNLFAGLSQIRSRAAADGMRTSLLMATPSGMAAVVAEDAPPGMHEAVGLFSVGARDLDALARAAGAPIAAEWLDFSGPQTV